MNRHFYRCLGCLDVLVLETRLTMEGGTSVATCGTCAQHFEYMGRVERDRLVQDRVQCKCDDRCTSARGPLCECQCGGKNHGAGLLGYVVVAVDAGAVPVVHSKNPFKATKALEQYRKFCALKTACLAELDTLRARRRSDGYLERRDFDRLRDLDRAATKMHTDRTHAARLKTLSLVTLPERVTPVSAVADAVTTAIRTAPPVAEAPFSLSTTYTPRPAKQTSLF